ncbi:hypothetical protein RD149_13645 [Gordonia westfalica]|uniref:ABC-type transporter Mla maintaining outer membrane lipid asymmetry, component MlaD n=1 Tax=Gordonia westfalica TaxID=158898 RepID=A0ABU2GTN4_9ACTN|nr:hypothetical protein [Gordonia westfalica]MDS1114812.1 hypothetical protein [Gordonia westfalica]
MVSGFLIGSDRQRQRVLRRAGAIVVALAVVAALIGLYAVPALKGDDPDVLKVTIDTTAVGPGVEAGTDVVMFGAPVGKVTSLGVDELGMTSVELELDRAAVDGLGRDFGIDFRPKNYFGITGVNISDIGNAAAGELRNGDHLNRDAGADYTMATMIEQGSDVANGSLVPETMDAIKRVLAYTSAFEPLIHTGVVLADVVERTQREMPAELLGKYNDIVDALPPFADGAISALFHFYNSELRAAGDEVQNNFTSTLKAISDNFFSMVGTLLKSNQANLTSTVELATEAASVLPAIGQGVITPVTVRDLVRRLDGAFGKKGDGTTVLKVNIALESLPGLAVPLTSMKDLGGR